ncbi:hypothetical protein GDO78_021623 [Eleutherodactylus coqui]|uniref:Uncharacterized protein n=1 Tax=Eleutherodactylus coqui TaxID=57060 RepID=A0A8J6B4B4_ELECQ|nr:hypothetical protein GDO78_021623 [Eleutherodactylus coqui]
MSGHFCCEHKTVFCNDRGLEDFSDCSDAFCPASPCLPILFPHYSISIGSFLTFLFYKQCSCFCVSSDVVFYFFSFCAKTNGVLTWEGEVLVFTVAVSVAAIYALH